MKLRFESSWIYMAIFVGSFIAMLVTMSCIFGISMLISIAALFVDRYVSIKNRYEERLVELETRMNQHLLENSVRSF